MEGLVAEGFVVLGGPLEDERYVLQIVDADSEAAIRERFASDPWWENGMLAPVAIERSTVLLDGR